MHLSWHGQYTIRLQIGETVVVADPHGPASGLPGFRGKSDLVLLSNPGDADMSYIDGLQGEPTVVNTPGEYSSKDISMYGLAWHPEGGSERSLFLIRAENIAILHVGALNRELTDKELQEIEKTDIDIIFTPVGGGSGLTTKQALKLITTIEPRMVIPIHYKIPKVSEKLDDAKQFAKEMGVSATKAEKKIIVKHSQLPKEEMQTIILAP